MPDSTLVSTPSLFFCLFCLLLSLPKVLSILDGSATCWPGVSAAHNDLEALVKLANQNLSELEKQGQQLAAANSKLQSQHSQLTSKLAGWHCTSHASTWLAAHSRADAQLAHKHHRSTLERSITACTSSRTLLPGYDDLSHAGAFL